LLTSTDSGMEGPGTSASWWSSRLRQWPEHDGDGSSRGYITARTVLVGGGKVRRGVPQFKCWNCLEKLSVLSGRRLDASKVVCPRSLKGHAGMGCPRGAVGETALQKLVDKQSYDLIFPNTWLVSRSNRNSTGAPCERVKSKHAHCQRTTLRKLESAPVPRSRRRAGRKRFHRELLSPYDTVES
jgi:hypothetical protein